MTQARTPLADVAELRGVLVAMHEWEVAGRDLVTVNDYRRFVGTLDAAAADELAGLALARLARLVVTAKGETMPTFTSGGANPEAVPGAARTPRQGNPLLATQRA